MDQALSVADDKKKLLVGLIAFVNGKPPPLEGDRTEDKTAKVTVEPLISTEKATEKAQGAEINVDVSKLLRREFKIHGIVAGDNFKEELSFVRLARQIESGIKAVTKRLRLSKLLLVQLVQVLK